MNAISISQLSMDPMILNIAMTLPSDFDFAAPSWVPNPEDYDAASILTARYIKLCVEHERAPATNNPSMVRWALEEILSRWNAILGRYYDR